MKRTTDLPTNSESNNRLFEDPVISRAAQEDPVVIFFAKWWKHLFIAVIALGAAAYARTTYRETLQRSKEEASETFAKAREQYEAFKKAETRMALAKLEKKDQAELTSIQKQSADALSTLRQQIVILKDKTEPYSTLGKIYEGLIAVESGDIAAAKSAFEPFKRDSLSGLRPEERLYVEGGMLALGKSLLEKGESHREGLQLLKRVAQEGESAHVVAALAVARVATNDNEKGEAKALLEQVKQKHPEQGDLINQELEGL